MKLVSASDPFNTRPGTACGGDVFVAAVDVAGLGDEGLSSRLGVIGRAESRLAAMKSQVLAEVERRHDATAAQRVARDELQSSAREAKRDVESAVRLSELSATSEALGSGEIPQGHARLIARASGEGDIDETALVNSAKRQDFDAFVKTVRRHQQDQSKDDGQSLLDRQRKSRKARIFESAETGMFVLSAEFDQITGARIATALTAKERQLWHNEDPKKRRTPQQRMADALAELICEPGVGKGQGTELLVIADYDVLQQQLVNARLADGSPIPIAELHRIALEAEILPSIFEAKSQNMWLGRARRTASEAQRVALMARDQRCVGCGANPLWCRAHHIIWWRNGGPTDLDNLLLVCDSCHHKIHEQGWTVYRHPTTHKYHLIPPASGPISSQNPDDRPNLNPKRATTMAFGDSCAITVTCRPPPPAAATESQRSIETSDRPHVPHFIDHTCDHHRLPTTATADSNLKQVFGGRQRVTGSSNKRRAPRHTIVMETEEVLCSRLRSMDDYESPEWHPAFEEYCETIYELDEDDLDVIQARIADRLEVSRPSVSEMVKRMEAEGLINVGDQITLTTEGMHLAETVVRRHRLAERFLTDVLGLTWAQAHQEAGKWEHIISPTVERAMMSLLEEPTTCPHGNPIPGSDYETPDLVALDTIKVGQMLTIRRITEELEFTEGMLDFLEESSIVPGSTGQLSARSPDGTSTVVIDGTPVVVGGFASARILVSAS